MKGRTITILPDSEDYTGYSTNVVTGISTSGLEVLSFQEEVMSPRLAEGNDEEQPKDLMFPETREELFLDEDLVKFYRKRGIKPRE